MPVNRSAAGRLRSATTVVDVSAATAPSSGQVLTATGSSAATWQTPSSGGELVVSAFPGMGAVQSATVTVDSGGEMPVVNFADGSNNRTWHIPFRVPSAANGLSISQIRIHYRCIGTTNRNLLLINTVYKYGVGDDTAKSSDTDSGTTYATGTATSTNHKYIDVSSTAYNGIGSLATGDLVMLQINRQGADASDTYGQAWEVLRVDMTFA